MEPMQIEPEIFNQGETDILVMPFAQDVNFTVGKLGEGEAIIHSGDPITLKLNAKYNCAITYQPSEICEFPFKQAAWNTEADELILEGMTLSMARRIVLRRRFPLIVEVVDGVVYSPSQNAVCETLGKIAIMKQQHIRTHRVFDIAAQPPKVHRNAETSRDVVRETYASVVAGTSSGSSCMTQWKPLTRIPVEGNILEPVAGPSRAIPCSPPKRQRVESATLSPSFEEMKSAVETTKAFFNRDLMQLFAVPHDRAAVNIPDQRPDASSLIYSYSQWQGKDIPSTNTVKMSYYLFGKDKKNVNMFLYKTKNKYTGHQCPLSLRECGAVLGMLVETMINALVDLAKQELEQGKAAAERLSGSDKTQALELAESSFTEKMQKLGRQ